MDSRFMKSIYIFDIFHFLIAANGKKAEYEKGKSMPLGSELSVWNLDLESSICRAFKIILSDSKLKLTSSTLIWTTLRLFNLV